MPLASMEMAVAMQTGDFPYLPSGLAEGMACAYISLWERKEQFCISVCFAVRYYEQLGLIYHPIPLLALACFELTLACVAFSMGRIAKLCQTELAGSLRGSKVDRSTSASDAGSGGLGLVSVGWVPSVQEDGAWSYHVFLRTCMPWLCLYAGLIPSACGNFTSYV